MSTVHCSSNVLGKWFEIMKFLSTCCVEYPFLLVGNSASWRALRMCLLSCTNHAYIYRVIYSIRTRLVADSALGLLDNTYLYIGTEVYSSSCPRIFYLEIEQRGTFAMQAY